ncbi:unnamed protein product [Sphagnum tenellum]
MKFVPPEKQSDIQFCYAVMNKTDGIAIQWFPSKFVFDNAHELATSFYGCFKYLPESLQTQELADDMVANMNKWETIDAAIPAKFRTTEIKNKMWKLQAAASRNLHLNQVPEEFQKDAAVACLARFPEDIPQYPKLLNEQMALEIARKNINSLKFIPDHFKNEEMADVLQRAIGSSGRGQYHYVILSIRASSGQVSNQNSGRTKRLNGC